MACALPSLDISIYIIKGGKTKDEANWDSDSNSNSGFKLKLLED